MQTLVAGIAFLVIGPAAGCGDDLPPDDSANTTGGAGGIGGAGGSPASGGGPGAGGGDMTGEGGFASDYEACLNAQNQEECEAVGGTWATIGLDAGESCECLTHQEQVPCTMQSQCLSACIAQPTDGVAGCDGIESGHCSPVAITVGCWCFFDEAGEVMGVCID